MINFGARPVETLLSNTMSWTLMLFTTTSPISRVFHETEEVQFCSASREVSLPRGGMYQQQWHSCFVHVLMFSYICTASRWFAEAFSTLLCVSHGEC